MTGQNRKGCRQLVTLMYISIIYVVNCVCSELNVTYGLVAVKKESKRFYYYLHLYSFLRYILLVFALLLGLGRFLKFVVTVGRAKCAS
jgi:hypothetical protein